MRVLIACEFSGLVRDAFTAAGHDATSCDLLPTEERSRTFAGIARAMGEQWGVLEQAAA